MIMAKKCLIITILLAFLVILPLCVACQDQDEEVEALHLSLEDVDSYYTKYMGYTISFPRQKAAKHYSVTVYPMGDMSHCVYHGMIEPVPTTTVITFDLDLDMISWQYLDVYFIAYNEDYSISSNILKYTIKCLVEDNDIYIAEEQEAGVIDGYDDPSYYYVPLTSKTEIVKSTDDSIKYALLHEDVDLMESIEMPLAYEGSYSFDTELGAIILNAECINSFELGAKIPIITHFKDGTEHEHLITLVSALRPIIEDATIERGFASEVTFDCLKENTEWKFAKVVVDGEILSTSSYYTSTTSVTIRSAFLNELSLGDHELRIYYKNNGVLVGCSTSNIRVDVSKSKAPYNLQLSYDDTYPNVKVSWDVDYEYQEAVLYINNVAKLSSINQSAIFNGNSLSISNYITKATDKVEILIKYADGSSFKSQEAYLDYDMSVHSGKEVYFNDKVSYIGKTCNRFITSEQELYDFIGYHINHYSDTDSFRLSQCNVQETYYLYSPYLVNKYKTIEKIQAVIDTGFDVFIEPLAFDITECSFVENEPNIIKCSIVLYSGSTRPYNIYYAYSLTEKYSEYPNSELHYYTKGESTRSSTYEGFKVNNIQKEAEVTTSLELALALEAGYKPVPVANSNAEKIYNKAKSVLREILDDEMSDYEKVLAIYDWITYNTIYDKGLEKETSRLKSGTSEYRALYKNSSFYAEGVFFYHKAVCNGIGSAFSILANIEGIQAIKVMGKVSSGSHTWVKVYVDGEWFICDPTWSNAVDYSQVADNDKYIEYITYDFFMLSADEATYNGREEFTDKPAVKYYAGDTLFDYYATSSIVYNNKLYTKYVKSIEAFEAILLYYSSKLNAGEEIQFSIRMDKKENSFLSMYSSEHTAKTWLEEYVNDHLPTGVTVSASARKNVNGTILSDFNNIVYIRVSKA